MTPVAARPAALRRRKPPFRRHFPGKSRRPPSRQGRFEGVATNLLRRYAEHATERRLPRKDGAVLRHPDLPRLRRGAPASRKPAVTVGGQTIIGSSHLPLDELAAWLESLAALAADERLIAEPMLADLDERIGRLLEVGVGYLTLERVSPTLSAGEAQRLRLASLLGSGLTGVLYVLDEPTIGLHPRDTHRLINVLRRLRDLGNTVLVVEHDLEMIRAADYLVDIGPGAGKHGGQIVAAGTPDEVAARRRLAHRRLSRRAAQAAHARAPRARRLKA